MGLPTSQQPLISKLWFFSEIRVMCCIELWLRVVSGAWLPGLGTYQYQVCDVEEMTSFFCNSVFTVVQPTAEGCSDD